MRKPWARMFSIALRRASAANSLVEYSVSSMSQKIDPRVSAIALLYFRPGPLLGCLALAHDPARDQPQQEHGRDGDQVNPPGKLVAAAHFGDDHGRGR